jgi:hypothetical protein
MCDEPFPVSDFMEGEKELDDPYYQVHGNSCLNNRMAGGPDTLKQLDNNGKTKVNLESLFTNITGSLTSNLSPGTSKIFQSSSMPSPIRHQGGAMSSPPKRLEFENSIFNRPKNTTK